MNIIGLVVSACVFGVAMSTMHGSVNILLALVTEVSTMMMKVTSWVVFISPIGIFFLTMSQVMEMDDLNVVAGKLGLYLITVIGGIIFHGFVILPLIYYIFTRKNPYVFIVGMGQAIVTAFGTGSRYFFLRHSSELSMKMMPIFVTHLYLHECIFLLINCCCYISSSVRPHYQ